ncbi:MAG TPA: glycosyltransferase family 39 protein [Tepidisphaeraceae bacterium]|nr:glycosyltransferase family 39 protein [Tepidisphaeraceae bacterium]
MTPIEPATPATFAIRKRTSVLLGLSLFLILARVPSYDEPLEWDMGMYTVVARELLEGERLYDDAWDMKPPAIFATFAAVLLVTGDDFLALYLLSVVVGIVTMLGVYHAASIAGRAAGLWAAAFWAAMCFDPLTGADRPNTEAFINAAVSWAFALWVRGSLVEAHRSRRRRWIGIALLFTLASLYKHVAIAPAVCLAIAEALFPPRGISRRRVLGDVALMATVGLLCWGAIFTYFAATGRAWLTWQTLFVNPRAYSGSMLENVLRTWSAGPIMWKFMSFMTPAAVLTVIAALSGARAAPRRAWLLLGALAIGTFLAVALPGSFLYHYFQLWFVPLAIGAGWGAAALPRLPGLRSPRLATAASALAVVVILYPQLSLLGLSGPERGRRKYGDFFMWANDSARAADAMLLPGETFYTWSEETYVYAVARRRPPAAGIWREHTLRGPLAAWLTKRTLEDLKRNPPELYLHWGTPLEPGDHPISRWAAKHYAPLPGAGRKHFPMFFYVRKGGALERRLRAPSESLPGQTEKVDAM